MVEDVDVGSEGEEGSFGEIASLAVAASRGVWYVAGVNERGGNASGLGATMGKSGSSVVSEEESRLTALTILD